MSSSARPRIIGAPSADAWSEDALVNGARHVTPPREDESLVRLREIEAARREGFDRGRAEGERAEQARLRQALLAVTESLDVMRENEERWVGAIEENITALAVAVARHIVDRELASGADVAHAVVRRALETFPIDQPVRVRLNPADLAVVAPFPEAGNTAALGATGSAREAHYVADPRVLPGGCVVEGRERIVDGRVDTALERVYRRIAYKDS